MLIISKQETSKIFDFSKKCFYTQNTKKSKEGAQAYSKFISQKMNEKFGVSFTVGAGSFFGSKIVSIYQKCSHGVRFKLWTHPKKVKPNRDISFHINRTDSIDCECGK